MKKNSSVDVYWSNYSNINEDNDWSIIYQEPKMIYSELNNKIQKENYQESFFRCSAFQNLFKHTFLIKNPIHSSFIFDNNNVIPKSKQFLSASIIRKQCIENNIVFLYSLPYIFFCEESLEITFSAPFFHQSPHLRYGAVTPGRYNIGKWYRPIQMEINLWDNIKEFEIKKDEPIAYISFHTDKKINMIQHSLNIELQKISNVCSLGGSWEPNVSLKQRYQRFYNSKINKKVLKNIKKEIL
jgi:hypothetical protein